jgi:3-oxoacyl-[acyl-carrier-protein] synthase-1
LGGTRANVLTQLQRGEAPGMQREAGWLPERAVDVGRAMPAAGALPDWPAELAAFDSRNSRLLAAAAEQIGDSVAAARAQYGGERIGVVLGSSTSGIAEGERAVAAWHEAGRIPPDYDYRQQEIGTPSEALARWLGVEGVAYTLSTACSSSAHALSAGRNLLALGLCDAVVVGGADSLCGLTLNGFAALESVAQGRCRPFAQERDGINIGEGAALFLMTASPGPVRLMGVGAACDAHHISSPAPDGHGAEAAMRAALTEADVRAGDIHYINLHGTATPQNDAMESRAVHRVFGAETPCSSTKALTGHTLGPAGAIETALCWLLLSPHNRDRTLPAHLYNGTPDPELAAIGLLEQASALPATGVRYCLSNSFAFGGNNGSVVLAGQ